MLSRQGTILLAAYSVLFLKYTDWNWPMKLFCQYSPITCLQGTSVGSASWVGDAYFYECKERDSLCEVLLRASEQRNVPQPLRERHCDGVQE